MLNHFNHCWSKIPSNKDHHRFHEIFIFFKKIKKLTIRIDDDKPVQIPYHQGIANFNDTQWNFYAIFSIPVPVPVAGLEPSNDDT